MSANPLSDGSWVLMLRQKTERLPGGGVWPRDGWSLGDEASGGNFARLDQLERYRDPRSGALELQARF